MARTLFVALTLSLLPACTPSQIVKDYARFSECSEDKVVVTDTGFTHNGSGSTYRASGCGNGADYVCQGDDCASPMITVTRRHAKQFGCGENYVTVDYLDGGSWRASGCDHDLTYHCFETAEIVLRCIAETDERSRNREN